MKSAQEMFALAGQRAVILKYSGGDVEFRVELEARGEKETHGQLLSRFGDDEQPKPGQTVEGYLLWVRSEADSAGFEQWKLANRRDLITTQTSGVQLSTPLVQAKLSQSKEEGQTSSRRSSQPVQVWSGKKHVGNLTLSSGTSLITNPLPTDREVCVKEINEERMQEPSAIARTGVSLLGLLACSEGGSLLSSSALTCGKTDEIADAYTVRVMCKAVSGKGK
jgi:hypothetical protein